MTDPDYEKALAERYGQIRGELDTMPAAHIQGAAYATTRKLGRLGRIEVIDHREESVAAGNVRAFAAYGAKVELDFQDGGQTLKIFVFDDGR